MGDVRLERVTDADLEDATAETVATVRQILILAFKRMGTPNPDARAETCQNELAEKLHVYSVIDLIEALAINQPEDSRKLVETRALLKDKLAKTLRSVVALLMKSAASFPSLPAPMKTRRTLTIKRVDVQQLSKISQKEMCFDIDMFIQLEFVNGAKDPDLSSPSDAFPVDVLGRPTFRPSAKWFLDHLDFTTLAKRPMHTRMSSVVNAGSNLQLNKKITGTFFDEFDGLDSFPFDMQTLTVTVVLNVANEGATPVDLKFADNMDTFVIDQAGFSDRNAWHIVNELGIELTSVAASSGRRYPAMQVSIRVYWRPFFFLLNVAMPAGLFALLAIVMMTLPVNCAHLYLPFWNAAHASSSMPSSLGLNPCSSLCASDPPARLTYMLTLMLTLVAYKLSMANSMPNITYLTSIDKYQLGMAAIVLAINFETTVLGTTHSSAGSPPPDDTELADMICQITFGFIWLIFNIWWAGRMIGEYMKRRNVYQDARKSQECLEQAEQDASIESRTFSRESAHGGAFVHISGGLDV